MMRMMMVAKMRIADLLISSHWLQCCGYREVTAAPPTVGGERVMIMMML